MAIILPEKKLAPVRTNPKILILYSLPKVGKTKSLSELENCLLIDAEAIPGADMYESLRIPVNKTSDLDEIMAAILEHGKKNGGKFPYKYIALDTVDRLEDFCEVSATQKYKRSVMGKTFEGDSVLDMPKGGGYYHLRNEVKLKIEQLSKYCQHLILVSHIKEKLMISKSGTETTSRDISLNGKLSDIVCAMADAIGYMYREDNKLMVDFKTSDGAIMGSRFPHLAGKTFEFDWTKIFI